MGGPPVAQLVGAPKPFTFSAAAIGQVFGVALDDNEPPNVYVAATSAYGLPIVAPGPDGQPSHIKVGAPGATFMRGLWGPQGGPGSIWKIDGATARVSLFANVTTNGRPNSGAALGGLAFDPDSKSLFVADRETGLIHRFALNGADLGSYDHGVIGRAAQGLPPAPWNAQQPIDITSPQFDSADRATWNIAAPERRIFGLAVHQRRLYYAVADSLQIWSVGLKADGSFGDDAVIELAAPPSAGPTEISKIAFDDQGRMFLAERPAPTGAFDLEALAVPAIGRVLRYAIVGAAPGGRRVWQEQPDEYAIGFAGDLRNGNGGLDFGYAYDREGEIDRSSCGGYLWSTGEDLRNSPDAALAERLSQTGASARPRPARRRRLAGPAPQRTPARKLFHQLHRPIRDDAARGTLGDVAIERACAPPTRAGVLAPPARPVPAARRRRRLPRVQQGPPAAPPGAPPAKPPGPPPSTPPGKPPGPPPPPNGCTPDQVRRVGAGACEPDCPRPDIQIGGKCCIVGELAAGGACSNSSCPAGETAIGPSNFCCNSNQVYTGAGGASACCSGPLVNGRCLPPTPNCPPGSSSAGCPVCAAGYVPAGGSLLSCQHGDLDRRLLSGRRGAERPQQECLQSDLPCSDRTSMLRLRPHPDRERSVLLAGQRDLDRRMLFRTGQRRGSVRVPEADRSHHRLRRRLYEDGGRNMLQQSICQRRRTRVPCRLAAVRARRDPRPARRLRPDPGRADPAARDQRARLPARRGADA